MYLHCRNRQIYELKFFNIKVNICTLNGLSYCVSVAYLCFDWMQMYLVKMILAGKHGTRFDIGGILIALPGDLHHVQKQLVPASRTQYVGGFKQSLFSLYLSYRNPLTRWTQTSKTDQSKEGEKKNRMSLGVCSILYVRE